MKQPFNPLEPWKDQVYYGDDRVGNEILFWSQPEYRYRALFSPVRFQENSGRLARTECLDAYQDFLKDHGECFTSYIDSLACIVHGTLVIYWNGDFQDIRLYFRLNDLDWLTSQVRYVEGVGDHSLDPRMILP